MKKSALCIGLTAALVGSAVVTTPAFASSETFDTVGSNSYVVPPSVYSVELIVTGGGGGGGNGGTGGGGCKVTSTVAVTPGDTIDVGVGGGGGGSGNGGGGGGSSFFNIADSSNRVVAGGGGGGGFIGFGAHGGDACEASTGAGGGGFGGDASGDADGTGGLGDLTGTAGLGGINGSTGGAGGLGSTNSNGSDDVSGGGAGGTGTGGVGSDGGSGGSGGGSGGDGSAGGKGGGGAGWGGGGGGATSGSGGAGGSIAPGSATFESVANGGTANPGVAGTNGSVIVTPISSYSITYAGNSADSGTPPGDATLYESGDHATVLANSGQLTRSGYVFSGWNTQADGQGTSYAVGTQLTIGSSNVTLYAKWLQQQTIAASSHPKRIANRGTTLINKRYAKTQMGQPLTAKVRSKVTSIGTRGDVSCYKLIKAKPRGLKIRTTGQCAFTLKVTYSAPGTTTLLAFSSSFTYRVKA